MDEIRLVINKNDDYSFGLEESYFEKNTHAQNKLFKMLPYTTTGKAKDYVVDFTGVVSEFIRALGDKKLSEEFDLKNFMNNIETFLCESEEKDELQNIIKSLFVDNGKLAMFDLKSYYYVRSSGSESKMAQFIYTLLVDENSKASYQELVRQTDSNILHKLVYQALPDLEYKDYNHEFKKGVYECLIPFVKTQFTKDFKFLIQNQDMVEKYLKRLLEYYYMFYVVQLSLKLNRFEEVDFNVVERIYMTLSWEVATQTRKSYEYGWQYVKEHLDTLFSHAITFEVLAHNNKYRKLTYKNIAEVSDDFGNLVNDLNWFIARYKEKKSDVDFSSFRVKDNQNGSALDSKVKELFQVIDFQFRNSSRTIQNKRYYDSLVKFVLSNFGKWRGRSGYSFNITESDIIMFVQIILGQFNGRIRLITLYEEFESRGLLFDRESKAKIVELLEKLNLLEKKSDSGDAQYVRSIL